MRVRAVLRSVAAAAGAPPDGRHQERIRIPLIATLLTGVAVGLLFDAATLGLRHLTGAPSFPENVSDLVVPYIPADTFGRLLSDLGPHGKEILVVGSLLGAGLAVVGLAAVYGALVSRDWRPLRLGVTLWLLATLALWILLGPVLDANDAGGTLLERRVIGILSLATCVAVATSAAALMFAVLSRSSATAVSSTALTPARGSLSRRSLLASVAGVSGGLVLGGGGLGAALQSFRGATNLDYEGHGLAVEALTPITATKDHYVVSKNLVDPSVDAARWRLEVKGLVASPVTLTLGELAGLTQHEEIVTLECIANGAGGTLMSTARWAGPRLADVVARAGAIHPAARFAVVSAVDGYYDSLTHDEAMARSTLVALRMNGQQGERRAAQRRRAWLSRPPRRARTLR